MQKTRISIKNPTSKISIIKEINDWQFYKDENKYPYFKNFMYSDYPNIKFLADKFKNVDDKDKYPITDLYLKKDELKTS